MSRSLKDLYHHLILERQKDPRGFEKRTQAQFEIEAYNPLCGDRFKIYVDSHEGRMEKISFHGYGCAISKASTSLLVEKLSNKNPQECLEILNQFFESMEGRMPEAPPIYAALAMSGSFPGRKQCATLSWDAFKRFLKEL